VIQRLRKHIGDTLGPITMKETRSLNRAFFILIFGAFSFQINGQIDTQYLQREWIAIECRHATDTAGIYIIEGKLMSFGDRQGESFFFWNDSLVKFNYLVKDSLIILDDTITHGKILHLNNDSLVLLVDNNTMITKYLPIRGSRYEISKQKLDTLLIKKSWIKEYLDGDFMIDFIDYNPFSPNVKYCNGILDNKYNVSCTSGNWSTFEYDGFVFLSIYINPDEYYKTGFFQITNFDSTRIHTKYLSHLSIDTVTLKSIENLSDVDHERLKNIFISKDWRLDSVQETYQFYGLESRWFDEEIIPISRYRGDWLLKEDFLQKDTKYSFSDSTYSITCNSLPVFEGRWSLSRDGSYLYLYNEKSGLRINKILEIENNKIILRQKIELKVSQETDDIKVYDFLIKLN
jgi:hypothetical protein